MLCCLCLVGDPVDAIAVANTIVAAAAVLFMLLLLSLLVVVVVSPLVFVCFLHDDHSSYALNGTAQ